MEGALNIDLVGGKRKEYVVSDGFTDGTKRPRNDLLETCVEELSAS